MLNCLAWWGNGAQLHQHHSVVGSVETTRIGECPRDYMECNSLPDLTALQILFIPWWGGNGRSTIIHCVGEQSPSPHWMRQDTTVCCITQWDGRLSTVFSHTPTLSWPLSKAFLAYSDHKKSSLCRFVVQWGRRLVRYHCMLSFLQLRSVGSVETTMLTLNVDNTNASSQDSVQQTFSKFFCLAWP